MTRYYIIDSTAERGCVEISEKDFQVLYGTDETRPYIGKVYMGEMSLDAVPAELQEAVNSSVTAIIDRHGSYAEHELGGEEALDIITGVSE